MNLPELYERAAAKFGEYVHAVRDDQWERPTPCTEWNVRALVNHLVYENKWGPDLFGGKTVAEVGDRYEGDLLGDDPKRAWDDSIGPALDAVKEPSALEKTVSVSWGEISGREYASQLFSDLVIHGWDLARGIGADDRIDPELAEACYRLAKPQEEAMKKSGAFGDKIEPPAGADRQTELLALFGRRSD